MGMLPTRRVITVEDERWAKRCATGRVVLIDDDADVLSALATLLSLEGFAVQAYASAKAWLEAAVSQTEDFAGPSCMLCDVMMPEMDGLALQRQLAQHPGVDVLGAMPLLLMSGVSGAREAAQAFRAGALDFLVKPIDAEVLLAAVRRALAQSAQRQSAHAQQEELKARRASLSARELEIALRVAQGLTNPVIAAELGIALRTVKLHRHRALEKLGAANLVDLVRIADEGGL